MKQRQERRGQMSLSELGAQVFAQTEDLPPTPEESLAELERVLWAKASDIHQRYGFVGASDLRSDAQAEVREWKWTLAEYERRSDALRAGGGA